MLLWDAKPDHRVAELLEQINLVIPLQSEHWDFQDYTVKLGDYECLHYQVVGEVLKEDDRVE